MVFFRSLLLVHDDITRSTLLQFRAMNSNANEYGYLVYKEEKARLWAGLAIANSRHENNILSTVSASALQFCADW